MMKFKQRVLVILCLFVITILYLWIKTLLKKSPLHRNPVVKVYNEESLIRTLMLESATDLDNLLHRRETTGLSSVVKRSIGHKKGGNKSTSKISDTRFIAGDFNVLQTPKLSKEIASVEERLVNEDPWELWRKMVTEKRITPSGTHGTNQVDAVLRGLRRARIVKATVGYKGTQLKASMLLEKNQKAVFKPKRYDRNYIIEDGPYSGFDRHNGEIAAFHLDRLLGFYRAPPVSGRVVNLTKEFLPVTHKALKKTFFKNGSNICFYGVCYYCKPVEAACADGDIMEASVTIWLPDGWNLKTWRHPWQRTYRPNRRARWETDPSYCKDVMNVAPYNKGPRLTSIIDTAIFDYFIGNADRHHYETFAKGGGDALVLHLDNGKSFGNPNEDELSILAPLYQCCRILGSTWQILTDLNNRKDKPLSEMLEDSLRTDPLAPILTQKHLHALDRRLMKIIELVKQCISKNGRDVVVVPG